MSDGKPKVAIPAWQRATPPTPPATEDPVSSQPETSDEPSTNTSDDQAQEPSNEAEPIEAKSSNDVVEDNQSTFGISDFETFKQHEQQQQQSRPDVPPQPVQQTRPAAPPIITYPEFLVEAHKPPPLITPTSVLNTVYAAGGAATLLYAASKWIISPMVDTLSESRHDFLTHSTGKVDEFNERLSKIVSKVPDAKRGHAHEVDGDDADSETSDPTELYHRDMGTQTSPTISPSVPDASDEKKKDAVTYQTGALEIMREHINELADGSEKAAEANKDRQDTVNKLRHYLDGPTYSSSGISTWQTSEDAISMKNDKSGEDAIEELKKEIRGVKGVLLSAKRFPAVSRPVAGAA
ncbi:hypothetical protein M409DRAFT_30483 [Zasmidium cellare ATCC 36951]|uniref:Uncharacterized protein n=1 Tax=Zasmidium cellare ATCC 36951 TaxID=1080233 RepID=A0A6A6BWV3_ZASCE|nr:uncharacterized protein M409DRAFT_30483 [Zasmidium cellare ATCC 36951]KAF2159063.1 hypothetical protein M409DRAFT_30483 [Zasmidium cellare ATCC 36951]